MKTSKIAKQYTSGVRPWLKNVACLSSLISHQLYRDPSHHLQIREAGVQYLMENPEPFIESKVVASWLRYYPVCLDKEHGLIIS